MSTDAYAPPLPSAHPVAANVNGHPAPPGLSAEELRRQARADLDSLPDWALDDVAEWLAECADHCRRFPLDGLPPLPAAEPVQTVTVGSVTHLPPNRYPAHVELD